MNRVVMRSLNFLIRRYRSYLRLTIFQLYLPNEIDLSYQPPDNLFLSVKSTLLIKVSHGC